MIRCGHMLLAAGLAAACAAGLHAADAPNAKLLGTWTHHSGDYRVRLEIKPDRLHCTIAGPDGVALTVDADYVVSKDGVVLGIVRTKGAEKDEDALQDRLFYFRVTARERALKVSELNCADDENGKLRGVLEGVYLLHDGKHAGVAPASRHEHPTRPATRAAKTAGAMAGGDAVSDEWQRLWNFFAPPSQSNEIEIKGCGIWTTH